MSRRGDAGGLRLPAGAGTARVEAVLPGTAVTGAARQFHDRLAAGHGDPRGQPVRSLFPARRGRPAGALVAGLRPGDAAARTEAEAPGPVAGMPAPVVAEESAARARE
ncbi:hypothetical protein GCM10010238_61370 [Streptomyces griseoviridis]|uniref:Uncharacterized protein n=1 Tax=Streptomyces griseoviridis TaxID=45398 RepID=A0A918GVE5_STRGD|nr:hypothetical protein GCM10010238_61370 [Streptomyces niveoruber]